MAGSHCWELDVVPAEKSSNMLLRILLPQSLLEVLVWEMILKESSWEEEVEVEEESLLQGNQ